MSKNLICEQTKNITSCPELYILWFSSIPRITVPRRPQIQSPLLRCWADIVSQFPATRLIVFIEMNVWRWKGGLMEREVEANSWQETSAQRIGQLWPSVATTGNWDHARRSSLLLLPWQFTRRVFDDRGANDNIHVHTGLCKNWPRYSADRAANFALL